MSQLPKIRFAAIGLNHGHIYGMTDILLEAGADLTAFHAPEDELASTYGERYPQAQRVADKQAILEDATVDLVISAGIPCDRAPLGLAVMRHGKDYMSDKPGFTTLAQLAEVRRVQAETGQIYSVDYSERFHVPSALKAGDLVETGAVGDVIQVTILAPHRRRFHTRPDWFFEKEKYGGILTDIGSHQFDQVLHFTGSTDAEIVTSQVANLHHPEYPELEDFDDAVVRGNGGLGYVRLDWFTPDGLEVWGDGRLVILGTEGYIEVRKYCDLAGRSGSDHLFLVDDEGTQYIDCSNVALRYGRRLIHDILHRTETAMTHAHCFLASELALKAEAQADRLGHLEASRG